MIKQLSRCVVSFWVFQSLLSVSFHALFAATATGTLSVSATIGASCSVNSASSSVAFNAYVNSTTNDVAGSVALTCTNSTSYTIALGTGGGTYATRVMAGASTSSTLNYNLYTTAGRTTVWGDGTSSTATVAGTGSGAQQTVSVYGRIPSGQTTAQPDTYSDSVAVTVTY